jgi:LPS O-antigen subunit length determinant protein (WzzB/FepE family)
MLEKPKHFESQMSLVEIINKLISSKKLILLITITITILGSIYVLQKPSVYKATALVEIGHYYDLINENKILTEEPKALIKELNIYFKHKNLLTDLNPVDLKFQSLGSKNSRLLQIDYKSHSSQINEKIINKIIIFIQNRHLDFLKTLTQKRTSELDKLNNKIENSTIIMSKVETLLNSNHDQNQLEFRGVLLVLSALQNQLIFESSKTAEQLEIQLESMFNTKDSETQLAQEIETRAVDQNKKIKILLSFILGLCFSLFIVFIIEFVKTFKKNNA